MPYQCSKKIGIIDRNLVEIIVYTNNDHREMHAQCNKFCLNEAYGYHKWKEQVKIGFQKASYNIQTLLIVILSFVLFLA